MAKNTNYNIIDESWDCNQKAVESSSTRVTNAAKVSMLPCDNIGNITVQFLDRQTSRKNGQSHL